MSAESDELAAALSRHGDATSEYVRVEQRIRDGLSVRRRHRWTPLLAVLVALVLAAPLTVFAGRAHFVSAPASSWPDASNTGVPAGVSLTAYTGPCTITTNNTVITGKLVDCTSPDNALIIRASNVQVINSSVLGLIDIDTDLSGATGWSLTMTDSEVDSGQQQRAAICCGNLTILRSDVQGGQTAIQCEAGSQTGPGDRSPTCDIRDSYLHGQDLPVGAQWHAGGFLSEGDMESIVVDHNYIICDSPMYPPDGGCTGDFNLLPHFGIIHDVTATNNKFGANEFNGYCVAAGGSIADFGPQAHHIVFTDNVWEHGVTGICGDFGPVTDCQEPSGGDFVGNVWSNNEYEDGDPVECF